MTKPRDLQRVPGSTCQLAVHRRARATRKLMIRNIQLCLSKYGDQRLTSHNFTQLFLT